MSRKHPKLLGVSPEQSGTLFGMFTTVFRSERYGAAFLLAAALIGLILSNTVWGGTLLSIREFRADLSTLGLHLSIGEWITDFLLVIFFFIVAVELRDEMTSGTLSSIRRVAVPALAAAGGVAAPALLVLLFTAGTSLMRAWPIPTATDVAFAVGVLAFFGRGIPSSVRVFLLAIAVLDDLIGIIFIAILFTSSVNAYSLGLASLAVAIFAVVARAQIFRQLRLPLLVALAALAWLFTHQSGIHPTIIGVALGLSLPTDPGRVAAYRLQPVSIGVVLPLFAFSSSLVAIPEQGSTPLSPMFWGVLIALPIGKVFGITLGGYFAFLSLGQRENRLAFQDLIAVGLLGGIGFTVSLLMAQLAFSGDSALTDEATLAVLLGSGFSILASAVALRVRARYHRSAASDPMVRGGDSKRAVGSDREK